MEQGTTGERPVCESASFARGDYAIWVGMISEEAWQAQVLHRGDVLWSAVIPDNSVAFPAASTDRARTKAIQGGTACLDAFHPDVLGAHGAEIAELVDVLRGAPGE